MEEKRPIYTVRASRTPLARLTDIENDVQLLQQESSPCPVRGTAAGLVAFSVVNLARRRRALVRHWAPDAMQEKTMSCPSWS